ncbi:hypothetical protein WJ972_15555 [Achromobacter insuavis]
MPQATRSAVRAAMLAGGLNWSPNQNLRARNTLSWALGRFAGFRRYGAFMQAGMGAITRTFQDKMRDTVSAKDFSSIAVALVTEKSDIAEGRVRRFQPFNAWRRACW